MITAGRPSRAAPSGAVRIEGSELFHILADPPPSIDSCGNGAAGQAADLLNYELPQSRIAARPCHQTQQNCVRSDSRLLVLDRGRGGEIVDRRFFELPELFGPEDLLLLNNSQVVPYRFLIQSPRGRPYELLLTGRLPGGRNVYRALAKPLRRIRPGRVFELGGALRAEVLEVRHGVEPEAVLRLFVVDSKGAEDPSVDPAEVAAQVGKVPIPPYIRRGASDELDRTAYQTVYASDPGSIAAPTAGLHFTETVLDRIRSRCTAIRFLTMHLGPASFQPVRGDIAGHKMPVENFRVERETAEAIVRTKEQGGRIVAVGTSTARTVESLGLEGLRNLAHSDRAELSGSTDLFITPGRSFSVVDSLITNFHQPGSTHLLLVAAFAGIEATAAAYHHALAGKYRFLSYGDSMVII